MPDEKKPRKIYLMHRLSVPSDLVDEFSQYWKEHTLPVWEQQGAKLLAAGRTTVGGPENEIVRLYEFESLFAWQKRQEAQWDLWEKEEGKGRTSPPKRYLKYVTTLEQRLFRAMY